MKKLFTICLILSVTFSHSQTRSSRRPLNIDSLIKIQNERRNALIGKPYPAFSVAENGVECSNLSITGKVVFINSWFATCAPCLAEMDNLNKLYEQFHLNQNFEFVSFTFESPAVIAEIKKKYNIHYNIFSITDKECERLNMHGGFPTNVIVDSSGKLRYISQTGKIETLKSLTEMISYLL